MVGFHGGNGAVGSGCHDLPQRFMADIAGCKDAGDVRVHLFVGHDVAVFQGQDVGKHIRRRYDAEEDEEAHEAVFCRCLDFRRFAGLDVAHRKPLQFAVAAGIVDDRIPDKVQLVIGKGLFLQGRDGTQFMAAMDDGDLAGKAGQEDGFLDGTVAAAGNVDVEAAEKPASQVAQ